MFLSFPPSPNLPQSRSRYILQCLSLLPCLSAALCHLFLFPSAYPILPPFSFGQQPLSPSFPVLLTSLPCLPASLLSSFPPSFSTFLFPLCLSLPPSLRIFFLPQSKHSFKYRLPWTPPEFQTYFYFRSFTKDSGQKFKVKHGL